MSAERPITKDTTLAETIARYPRTEKVLIEYGLHCVGCEVASFETVGEAATTHGIKDLTRLLDDLNRAV
jgi:hybrid cluster-associated redox disulfide protein